LELGRTPSELKSQINNHELAEIYAFKKMQLDKSNPKKDKPVELPPDDLAQYLQAWGAKPA
jgi:hypothetical protein|tara:strand:+ start:2633 stop:2815 length:183 start_codon:yes stop_codon:yes gene_type:complete